MLGPEDDQLLGVQGAEGAQIGHRFQQLGEELRLIGPVLGHNILQTALETRVHLLDQLQVAETGSVGCDQNDGAEESDLGVRQVHRVHALRKVEGRIDQEAGIGAVLDGVPPHHLPVQADDRVDRRVEHADEPHEEGVEEAGLQQRELVVLGEQLEAGNHAGKVNDTPDNVGESLRELLLRLQLRGGIQRTGLQQRNREEE